MTFFPITLEWKILIYFKYLPIGIHKLSELSFLVHYLLVFVLLLQSGSLFGSISIYNVVVSIILLRIWPYDIFISFSSERPTYFTFHILHHASGQLSPSSLLKCLVGCKRLKHSSFQHTTVMLSCPLAWWSIWNVKYVGRSEEKLINGSWRMHGAA
jgi:hypothetical protein